MQPFFFGEASQPLYGVCHEPAGDQLRTSAILICNPLGHEYIRSHRALVRLAVGLANKGYYVMRFDYRGTGDSSGHFETLTLGNLLHDIQLANEELLAISGAANTSVVGLRAGGSLAMLARAHARFRQTVAWDPVLDGSVYVQQLRALQQALLASSFYYNRPRLSADTGQNELLGFDYAESLLSELSALSSADFMAGQGQNHCLFSHRSLLPKSVFDDCRVVDDMGDWNELLFIETSLTVNNIQAHLCGEVF